MEWVCFSTAGHYELQHLFKKKTIIIFHCISIQDLAVDESAVEAEEEEYTWNSDYDINQYGYMKGKLEIKYFEDISVYQTQSKTKRGRHKLMEILRI